MGSQAVALGLRLRNLRRAASLTQHELARRSGMTQANVWRLELGLIRLTERARDRLAAGMGMEADELARLLDA
jgi:transcriptional regulator with XRE-family HTH domain